MNTLSKTGCLVALLSLFATSAMGCSSAGGEETGTDEGATTGAQSAPPMIDGVPLLRPPALGYMAWGVGFNFVIDPTNPSAGTYQRAASGNDPFVVQGQGEINKDSRNHKYGWASNDPWSCKDAVKFIYDQDIPDTTRKCRIEMGATGLEGPNGSWELGAVVIPVGDDGDTGFSGYQARVPALPKGSVQPITAGPPRTVNVTMDKAAVVKAMKDAHAQFSTSAGQGERVDDQTRNDCLKNFWGASWTDSQAHYYCLLPKEHVRTCYSKTLRESARAGRPDPVAAYNACFAPNAPGRTDEAKWIHENQEAVFKYIMFTKQATEKDGVASGADFNLESEQEAINEYYGGVANRPRRLMDVYPGWNASQPRYDKIRAAQAKALSGATAAPGGSQTGSR